MYTPPPFRLDDETALRCAAEWNFAALITLNDGGRPFVTHLPFLVDHERRVLRGHLARANPHAAHLESGEQLVVFTGPNTYISPDWYGEGEDDAPTWNYVAVHVTGPARIVSDEAAVDDFLADISAHEEHRRHDLDKGGKVWTMEKLEPRAIERMRRAIVAFEIDIGSIDAKAKLSQNKKPHVAARVIETLASSESETGETVARWMTEARRREA